MILGLQYLRAYAALLVLIFHVSLISKLGFVFGAGGVDIFFVLSGFLMWVITDEHTSPRKFMFGRIIRIVPLYWLVTITMFGLESTGLSNDPHLDIRYLIASLLFIPHHLKTVDSLYPLVTAGWTLNFEMFFYVVFSFVLMAKVQLRPWILTAIFGTLSMVGFIIEHHDAVSKFYFNNITLEFVFGVWLGIAWKRGWVLPLPYAILLTVFGTVAICISHLIPAPRFLAYGFPSVCLIAGVLGLEKSRCVRKNAFFRLLGDASYSIYLWHAMAIAAAAMVLNRFGIEPLGQFCVLIVIGIAVGIVSFITVEHPLMQLKRRYRRKSDAAFLK